MLTGLSLAIAYLLDVHLGFSFSAGLIDLLLYGTAPAAKNIPLLIGMDVVFFVVYYLLFRFAITKWDMRTPGREPESEFESEEEGNLGDGADSATMVTAATAATATTTAASARATDSTAERLIAAFGGRDNLVDVDACITRLRMEVVDTGKVDQSRLKSLGAAGVIEVGKQRPGGLRHPGRSAEERHRRRPLGARPTAVLQRVGSSGRFPRSTVTGGRNRCHL